MSCGLKKTQELNGVHLTERTCSPYNPIIKLIVDDCLGLPVYPVTSIDAVIDEEGNTLRVLLEKLSQYTVEGINIEEIISRINDRLGEIEDSLNDSTSKLELNSLKSLVWAISSLAHTDPEQHLLTNGIPTIVYKINSLEQAIRDLPFEGSIESLNTAIENLRDILLAVANFNTNAFTADGITHYDGNQQIKIIKEIIDIKTSIQLIQNTIGSSSAPDTIIGRLHSIDSLIDALKDLILQLITKINQLKELVKGKANLDNEVLALKINKLEADEYPVTSAMFYDGTDSALKELNKFLNDDDAKKIFIYFKKGSILGFSLKGEDLIDFSKYDLNADGLVNAQDLILLHERILGNVTGNFDLNSDTEINIADANELIDFILTYAFDTTAYPTQYNRITVDNSWTKYIFEISKASKDNRDITVVPNTVQKLVYDYFNTFNVSGQTVTLNSYKVIAHPLIDGKIYINSRIDEAYRYEEHGTTGLMCLLGEDINTMYLSPSYTSEKAIDVGKYVVTPLEVEVYAKPSVLDTNSSQKYSIDDLTTLIAFLLNSSIDKTSKEGYINAKTSFIYELNLIVLRLREEYDYSNTTVDESLTWDEISNLDVTTEEKTKMKAKIISDIVVNTSECPTEEIVPEDIRDQIKHMLIPFDPSETILASDISPISQNLGNNSGGPISIMGTTNDSTDILIKRLNTVERLSVSSLNVSDAQALTIAKYDINGDGTVNVSDVTDLISILLSNNATNVNTSKVYYLYKVGKIVSRGFVVNTLLYNYEVEDVTLLPGKRLTVDNLPDEAFRFRRSYIDYKNCVQPNIDDYNITLGQLGWLLLTKNGFTKNAQLLPVYYDNSQNIIVFNSPAGKVSMAINTTNNKLIFVEGDQSYEVPIQLQTITG